jgi:tetratricopeptide (TPR) repeat protein
MKVTAIALIAVLIPVAAIGQTKKPPIKPQKQSAASGKSPRPASARRAPASTSAPRDENAEFEAAVASEPLEKVNLLKKFIVDFPRSQHISRASELLVVARAAVADEKLRTGDAEGGVTLFKLAVMEAPDPIPEKLFNEIIAKFPYSLYWNGQRPAAIEIASAIEARVSTNASQLVSLANFFASIENGAEAQRLAEAALKADPASSPAYQTIGLAHRLNFELEKSAEAYAKALEIDPASLNSKQSLAEMHRALGEPAEAEKLYREMLAVSEGDIPAQTGLVLSLFDGGKKADAEAEMEKALGTNPKNVILLAGAAYWYAANGSPDKAIELAEKAIELEPRYIWSYIAMAHGLMGKQKAVDAERVLTKARGYGNFPTVEYELASARIAAGFYREAAEDLQKYFAVKDGSVRAKLGGRVERDAASFEELVGAERRASIFTPIGGGEAQRDQKLKQLLEFHYAVSATGPDPAAIGAAADAFAAGDDVMRVHRELYAASVLLQKNVALDKVVDLTSAATGNTDQGLNAANAAAAVMASELYDSRALAFSRNEFLAVPDVSRQTLSGILRGRVEDLTGWALYQQSKYPEAVTRLRRAVSVLPDKSAWWRASMWRLGAALAADGKDRDALGAYIESYKTDKPDLAKFSVVESMYKRVNDGSTAGLEEQIGKDRVMRIAETGEPSTATPPDMTPDKTDKAVSPEVTQVPAAETRQPARIPRGVPIDRTATIPDASVGATDQPAGVTGDLNKGAQPATVVKADEKTAPPEPQQIPREDPPRSVPADSQPASGSASVATPTETPSEGEKSKTESPAENTPAVTLKKPSELDPTPTVEEKPLISPPSEPREEPPLSQPTAGEDPEPRPPDKAVGSKTEDPAAKQETPASDANLENGRSTDPARDQSKAAKPDPKIKPLFEPIVITIPSSRPSTLSNAAESVSAGMSRQRIIEGIEIKAEEIPACTVGVSQENISLINGGGTIGVIVTTQDETTGKQLVATSSSPADVEILADADLADPSKQHLFIIKSISSTPGVYQVRFATACGRKDVIVTVR